MAEKFTWPPVVEPALLERQWTNEEWLQAMSEDVFEAPQLLELMGGKLRLKPRKSPAYCTAVGLTYRAVASLENSQRFWRTQCPMWLGERDLLDPVYALVSGVPRDYGEHHPRQAFWVIEIADESLDFFRDTKGALYAKAFVPEFWFVNLVERNIEVYRLPESGENSYRLAKIYSQNEEIPLMLAPQQTIGVAGILP